MPLAPIERPPERVPVIGIFNGVAFPHTPQRTISFTSMPSLIKKIEETRFCIVACMPQAASMTTVGTIAYVKKVGKIQNGHTIIIFPLERVGIKDIQKTGDDGKQYFYSAAWEKITETPIPEESWARGEQEREELDVLFGEYLRNVRNRTNYFILAYGGSPATKKLLQLIDQAHEILPQLRQSNPRSFGAVLDKISDAVTKIYTTMVLTPKDTILILCMLLLTLRDHKERLAHLLNILAWFAEDFDSAITPEVENMLLYTEEQIYVIMQSMIENFQLPVPSLMSRN